MIKNTHIHKKNRSFNHVAEKKETEILNLNDDKEKRERQRKQNLEARNMKKREEVFSALFKFFLIMFFMNIFILNLQYFKLKLKIEDSYLVLV